MDSRNLSTLFSAAMAIGLMAGCATKPTPPPAPPQPPKAPPPYTWNDNGATGPAKIVVDLSAQRAYFYRGDTVVGETKCSTGKRGFATAQGNFAVIQKDANHYSNLYGSFVGQGGDVVRRDVDMSKMTVPEGCSFKGAKMPFYLRFTGGYGLHAGYVPNYPASHGCVRLPRVMAERFYHNVQLGTPVIVHD